jgi:hypothetical protein
MASGISPISLGIGDCRIEARQVLAVGLQERRQQWLGRCMAVDEWVRAQRLERHGPVAGGGRADREPLVVLDAAHEVAELGAEG